tara:strand:- start:4697 stop:5191 length:495 start_codon:yes stop_codon:yes gene_type:complete
MFQSSILNAAFFLGKTAITYGCILITPIASADREAEYEAERLLEAMELDVQFKYTMEMLIDQEIKSNPEMAPFREVLMSWASKVMSFESVKPDLIRIFSEAFTATELRLITAFHKTEVGKKAQKLLPEIMAKGAAIGEARGRERAGELEKMLQAELERQQKITE